MRSRAVMASLVAAIGLTPAATQAQVPDADPEGWDDDIIGVGVPTIDLEARAGVAVPLGDLMHYSDPGLHLGLGGAWWVSDHVALRADGDIANMQSDAGEGLTPAAATPDLRLYHYGMGVELDVPGRVEDSPWSMNLNVGAGGTTLDTEAFLDIPQGREDITRTFPNVNAGAEIGRVLGENFLVSVSGRMFYTFMDETELAQLSALRASELEDGVSLPVTLSVRWDVPPAM